MSDQLLPDNNPDAPPAEFLDKEAEKKEAKKAFWEHFMANFMRLFFEFLGTCFLTCLFMAEYNALSMFLGVFVLLLFCWRISESHFNPVVTLAWILREDEGHREFGMGLGLLYMLAQVAGAYLGGLFGFYFFRQKEFVLTLEYPYHVLQCMFSEVLGSFILVIGYLSQTQRGEKVHTKLVDDQAITMMAIAAFLVIGMSLSHPAHAEWTQSPLNPAIALAVMSYTTFDGNIDKMHFAWIFLTHAWIGSVLAWLVFRYLFHYITPYVEPEEFKAEMEALKRAEAQKAEAAAQEKPLLQEEVPTPAPVDTTVKPVGEERVVSFLQ